MASTVMRQLHTNTAAPSTGEAWDIRGASVVGFQIVLSGATVTVVPQVSNDGENWVACEVKSVDARSTVSTSLTAAGGYEVLVGGWQWFRCNATAVSGGTMNIHAGALS